MDPNEFNPPPPKPEKKPVDPVSLTLALLALVSDFLNYVLIPASGHFVGRLLSFAALMCYTAGIIVAILRRKTHNTLAALIISATGLLLRAIAIVIGMALILFFMISCRNMG
ncbi:MAG: hypothetical protein LBU36_01925 [Clostridiales bacterium]|jgi:hypothetical protein|nr:hypothetical protein [Clostridiales bacterium]